MNSIGYRMGAISIGYTVGATSIGYTCSACNSIGYTVADMSSQISHAQLFNIDTNPIALYLRHLVSYTRHLRLVISSCALYPVFPNLILQRYPTPLLSHQRSEGLSTATSVRGYTIYYTDNNLHYSPTRVLSTGLKSMEVNDLQGRQGHSSKLFNERSQTKSLKYRTQTTG